MHIFLVEREANVAVHLAQGPTRSQEEAKILFNAKNSQNG